MIAMAETPIQPPSPYLTGPSGRVIDGKAVADTIRAEVAAAVAELKEKTGGKVPGLAVIIVGDRKDSRTYVAMKHRACAECGVASFSRELPATATQEEVLAAVRGFNADPAVHGILVQLPLPKHVDAQAVIEAISPQKDVDGFHPHNVGALATLKGPEPLFAPCTPLGCVELLDRLRVPLAGARAVVVGRSNVVGLPLALLLLRRDATVTVCHSATVDMASVVRAADVVVAAAGRAGLVRGEWLKPGAVVIDVGTNAVDDSTKKAGYRLVGDCDFEGCLAVEGARVTPVPGGVGPMTIALLMRNTLEGARRALLPPPSDAKEGE